MEPCLGTPDNLSYLIALSVTCVLCTWFFQKKFNPRFMIYYGNRPATTSDEEVLVQQICRLANPCAHVGNKM